MPKPLKVGIWVVVFALCAGVGAFVASRSNPFPPGVEDPGAHQTLTPTPTQPAPTAWDLTMHVDSQHTLHEGGACHSDWDVSGTVEIQPNGEASGVGDAKLAAPASCDFAQSQVQTKELRLVITGDRAAGVLKLSFSEALVGPLSGIELTMTGMPGMANHAPMPIKGFSTKAAGKDLVVSLPRPLPAGSYELKWHAVAADQHRIEGSYTFSVR